MFTTFNANVYWEFKKERERDIMTVDSQISDSLKKERDGDDFLVNYEFASEHKHESVCKLW